MNERLDLTKVLKDCPEGMELDCAIFDNVALSKINFDEDNDYPIEIETNNGHLMRFTKYGTYTDVPEAKCLIFPKGKNTWEGFQRPFIDGDILTLPSGGIFIYRGISDFGTCRSYCGINCHGDFESYASDNWCRFDTSKRLATEEEKRKLFGAIRSNGYKWDSENKILEKVKRTLEELGDMEDKGNISDGYHTFNELYEYRLLYNASMFNELAKQGLYDIHKSKKHSDGSVPFGDENWFIVQAELPTGQISNHYEMKDWDLFNVPEKEKANPYDGHTPKDVAKRLRNFLTLEKIAPKFKMGDIIRTKNGLQTCKVIDITSAYYSVRMPGQNCVGIIPVKDQDDWILAPNKFDPKTLKHFDKVLVRQYDGIPWSTDFYSYYDEVESNVVCTGEVHYDYCIPYNDNTKHLVGKLEDAPELYKYWEE